MTSGKSSVKPETKSDQHERQRVFGRRHGRPLNKSRKEALDGMLPALGIEANNLHEDGNLSPSDFFDADYKEFWMEIGFGDGKHLSLLMEQHPDIGFFGIEPYINGMAAFLKTVQNAPHENVRVLMDDALLLVRSLKAQSLERLYILNPDPWPKKRHHKRRIINQDNLDQFSHILKPGGLLITATDVDDMAEWIVTELHRHLDFRWTAKSCQNWQTPPKDWATVTRYAQKGLEAGRTQRYLLFEKI